MRFSGAPPGEPLRTVTRHGLTIDVHDHRPPDLDADAPTAVLLHGFPQGSSAWDAVVPLLVRAGVRVLVPDQRGYSPGARPRGRRPYVQRELTGDVTALLDRAGVATAHLVGHDWGGTVAWTFADRCADRTVSLTVLSTPHPVPMGRALRHRDQARRSRYMLGFQVPWLPESRLLARDGARLRRSLLRSGLAEEHVDRYVARMLEPGALTGALAWYRAIPVDRETPGRIRVPTTYLTGRQDPFFAREAIEGTAASVVAPFRHVEVDADHWLPEHRPQDVADAVLAQLGRDR